MISASAARPSALPPIKTSKKKSKKIKKNQKVSDQFSRHFKNLKNPPPGWQVGGIAIFDFTPNLILCDLKPLLGEKYPGGEREREKKRR
jgi:hypothetical protein